MTLPKRGKTKAELQAAVDEIREVCRRHGVALVGTSSSEGIYGEITIGEATQKALGWTDVEWRLDNEVKGDDDMGYWMGGIGDIKP